MTLAIVLKDFLEREGWSVVMSEWEGKLRVARETWHHHTKKRGDTIFEVTISKGGRGMNTNLNKAGLPDWEYALLSQRLSDITIAYWLGEEAGRKGGLQ